MNGHPIDLKRATLAGIHLFAANDPKAVPAPYSEEWYAQADRMYEQRKADGSAQREREERDMWEQQQALDNVGRLWP